jgi:hypothetical protein
MGKIRWLIFFIKTVYLGNLEQAQTFSFRMSSASKLIGVSIANRASI